MLIDFAPRTYTDIDFDTPIYTLLDLRKTTYTDIDFTSGSYTLIFDDLNIPQFLTDDLAIDALSGRQAYQLIESRVVKVTPSDLMSNLWLNLGKAFSYLRRAF